uniref:DNA repair protein RAD50 (inferred by orthology to a human protein) n=1 Tax=Strongyloides venezuelensis TaxID=75913 RepID=A0A0K0F7A2_STRVS
MWNTLLSTMSLTNLRMVCFIGLKIQGIRSVGQEPEVINFLDPLTLIQGENGTGKTTLIEALKFITTGALPSGKMQAFIHNNLLAQKKRVDALVQLEFENAFGQRCTVTKRMNASVKGDKTTTKSDDFTLTVVDKDGRENSISSKVADCNREMLKHLGVSKAILENVIFCHQEDSCWPLGEPKDLKTKFDEIFEVAKYVKAVEHFKKLGREYETSIKIIDAELPHLVNNRTEYIKILNDSHKYKDNKKNLIMEIGNIENENKCLQNRLIAVREQRKAIEDKEREVIDLTARRTMLTKQIKDSPSVEVYDGDKEKLLEEIEQLSVQTDFNKIDNSRSKIVNDCENIDIELASCKDRYEEVKKRMKDMNDDIKKLNDLKFEKTAIWDKIVAENSICKGNYANEIECLNCLINSLTVESANYKNSKEEALRKLKEEYSINQLNLLKITNLINQIAGNKVDKENELRSAETSIQLLKNSMEGTVDINSQINEKQKELDSIDQKEIRNIGSVLENKRIIEDTIGSLKTLKDCLEVQTSKNKEFEFELFECKNVFENILGNHFIYGELYKNMKESIVICENEIKNKEKLKKDVAIHLNESDKRCAAYEAIYKKYTEESKNYRQELQDLLPNEINIVKDIVVTEQNIKNLQKKINLIEGSKMVYESWLGEIENCQSCPLCKSEFQYENSRYILEKELVGKVNNSPDKLEQLKKELCNNETILKCLKRANDLNEKFNSLQFQEIPKQQKLIDEANKEKNKYLEDVALLDNEIKRLSEKLNNMKRYECKAVKLDKLFESCQELTSKVNDIVKKSLVNQIPEVISFIELQEGYTVQFIEEKLSQFFQELERVKNYISKVNAANQKKNNLIEEIQNLTRKQLETLKSTQEISQLKEKIYNLKDNLEDLNTEYQTLVSQMPDLEAKNAKNRMEIEETEKELYQIESTTSRKLIKLGNDVEILENKEKTIDELEKKILKSSLTPDQLVNKLNEIHEKIKSLELMKVNSRDKLLLLDRQKDLLLTKQQQLNILNLKNELYELERKILANEYRKESKDKLIDEENYINNEIARTAVEISSKKGELKETEKRIGELDRTLNEAKYCDAEKNLREKVIRKTILRKTIKDLGLCQKVLDNSIIKFHEDKMKEINLSLCELWKKVYTGNDIEFIKIKSKPMSSTGDKRKSYDYAVVMVVDGNEIEMRDRCSAGQKMLASILIRIALCEVFCYHCPIIALDEPTTNLDVNKVENIADMLRDLVSYRINGLPSEPKDDCCIEERMDLEKSWANSCRVSKNFSNFQLIVITHDIQLTHLLYRNFKPEYVYQLRKENDGTSRITSHTSIE